MREEDFQGSSQRSKAQDRCVLPLSLPLLANLALNQVVISDFPDPSLVNNITKNISINIGALSDTPGVAATHSAVRPSLPPSRPR